jgi:hypothetical protein
MNKKIAGAKAGDRTLVREGDNATIKRINLETGALKITPD